MAAHQPYGPPNAAVLHVDVDAFFCQVEVLRNPSLRGLPLAIRQDQDTISVNYPARKAGVKKHMAIDKARELLHAAGGAFPHVFTADDGRVSYQPYREASGALMRLLQNGLPPAVAAAVLVVEKASIDEAFVLLDLNAAAAAAAVAAAGGRHPAQGAPLPAAASRPATKQRQQHSMQPGLDLPLSGMAGYVQGGLALGQAHSAAAAAASCQDQQPATAWDLSAAVAVAEAVRSTVEATLGLTVSVGVAPNRFLAKLASRAAKPDGVWCIDSVAAVQALLQGASVDRLPGLGGAVASALARAGLGSIAALQAASLDHLTALLGGAPLAVKVASLAWGRDTTAIVAKGPAKSIQVQMTLSVHRMQDVAQHSHASAQQQPRTAAAGAGASPTPRLLTGCADSLPRLTAVLAAMCGDLLGRVMLDRYTEGRWPTKLVVGLTLVADPTASLASSGSSGTTAAVYLASRSVSRSCAFPHIHLATMPAAADAAVAAAGQADVVQQQQLRAGGAGEPAPAAFAAPGVLGEKSYPVSPQLQAAVVDAAASLAQAIMSQLTTRHVVLQANIAASQFAGAEALRCRGGDIRTHFAAAAAGPANGVAKQQQQQQQPPRTSIAERAAAAMLPPAKRQQLDLKAAQQSAARQQAQQLQLQEQPEQAPGPPPQQQHQQQAPHACEQAQQHAPCRLSQVLLGLCNPQLTAAAASADLERLWKEAAAAVGGGGAGSSQGQPPPRLLNCAP